MPTNSPWLHQLKFDLKHPTLTENYQTDIAIIGGGIAGVATAFFALKNSTKKITLIEGYKIAHGATGHNAGQIVSYFEHPFADIVKEHGLTLAARAQEAIYYAWDLLDEIYQSARLKTPISRFTGYAGCVNRTQLLLHLKNLHFQRQAGLRIEEVLIAENKPIAEEIPAEFAGLYGLVPQEYILNVLQTSNPRYIGALASRKGCLNSALFCEEVIDFLLSTYPGRFTVFEQSPITNIVLKDRSAILQNQGKQAKCRRVVLCTNGFENFTIHNSAGEEVDKNFHDMVQGRVGYMAAYLEPLGNPPTAISYLSSPDTKENDPYFYFTRREYEHKELGQHNLICIGGPEDPSESKGDYDRETHLYPERARAEIDDFIKETYRHALRDNIDYLFQWHGLMGYTPTKLRIIGPEPRNKTLLYNLGCNGVGILSSIYGGKRISQFLNRERLEKSVFDPR